VRDEGHGRQKRAELVPQRLARDAEEEDAAQRVDDDVRRVEPERPEAVDRVVPAEGQRREGPPGLVAVDGAHGLAPVVVDPQVTVGRVGGVDVLVVGHGGAVVPDDPVPDAVRVQRECEAEDGQRREPLREVHGCCDGVVAAGFGLHCARRGCPVR
jgi:hypothetical protein